VAPIIRDNTVHGYVFAGAWRVPGPAPEGSWLAEWQRLPAWSENHGNTVMAALTLVADGLWDAAARCRQAVPTSDRAGRIRTYVRERLAHTLGLDGLARHLGLSPSRTSHAVREACGASLQAIIADERLAAAKRLLAGSTDSVAQIGAQVGWPDTPHFTRTFRRLTGLPPGLWRERHRLA
jgi:AraC-like DNA-binding protein